MVRDQGEGQPAYKLRYIKSAKEERRVRGGTPGYFTGWRSFGSMVFGRTHPAAGKSLLFLR